LKECRNLDSEIQGALSKQILMQKKL
jgi:hypothetical protein